MTGFDPQALTSLTPYTTVPLDIDMGFRSTGSYEPDPSCSTIMKGVCSRFDPQALTSLTLSWSITVVALDSFDPQALTSLTQTLPTHGRRS